MEGDPEDDLNVLGQSKNDLVYIRDDTTEDTGDDDAQVQGATTSGYTSTRSVSEASSLLPMTAHVRNGTSRDVIRGALSKNTADVYGGLHERIQAMHRSLLRGDEMLLETGIGAGALVAAEKAAALNRPISRRAQTTGTQQFDDVRRTRIAQRFDLFSKMPPSKTKSSNGTSVNPSNTTKRQPLKDRSVETTNRSNSKSTAASNPVKSQRDALIRDAYKKGLTVDPRLVKSRASEKSSYRGVASTTASDVSRSRPSTPPITEMIVTERGTTSGPFVVNHQVVASSIVTPPRRSPKAASPSKQKNSVDGVLLDEDDVSLLSWREENLKWSAAWALHSKPTHHNSTYLDFNNATNVALNSHELTSDIARRWKWLQWESA